MRVFLTGATGFIGPALARDLLAQGHEVIGLARTDAAADRLRAIGVQPHRGSLKEPDTLRRAAGAADGVIHLAYTFSPGDLPLGRLLGAVLGGAPWRTVPRMMRAITATNDAALDAIGMALEGSGRPLVTAFATMGVAGAPGHQASRAATEADGPNPDSAGYVRSVSEARVRRWAERGVRASIVRLAPAVHGSGDTGLIPQLAQAARKQGEVLYVDDGAQRWTGVHHGDAVTLFRLALEQGAAGGVYHGVGDPGLSYREIATIMGKRLGLPVRAGTSAQARRQLGFTAPFVATDNPVASDGTRRELGWTPVGPTLREDLEGPAYFRN
ncbi:SDR family oxidoreductase [Sphingomonas aracearum]|uniref:NAD-dependent epimerase/dehydratase family protein n=1 Tax=Sphingomonas aracearum TaxID=2283317 RepID=A0A369VWY9_9SPHN|nr:SDR family oxidoreductase [Sphingomonas aracearum]RDE05592.1 NAD-dependent epimerase/dehydratase family protein [Sphingomonas aracearum]